MVTSKSAEVVVEDDRLTYTLRVFGADEIRALAQQFAECGEVMHHLADFLDREAGK